MTMDNVNLNQYWASLIIEELVRCGVNYICIAPGSRSTPLVVAAARHPEVETFIGYDERSLGFHALGYAKATNSPAAIITTSGTAVANLYPAVVEASADSVPMVILTADRPPELMDTGANQTICQDKIFGTYVRWYTEIPCPNLQINPAMILTTVDQAVYQSKTSRPGPIHLNCRYREPLEPLDCPIPPEYSSAIKTWRTNQCPFTLYTLPKQILSETQSAMELIQNSDRGMIVVGHLQTSEQIQGVLKLANTLGWTTYADISSGLRFSKLPLHLIRYYDQQLLSTEFNEHVKPSVVLHFGGRTTSKRVWQYFDQNHPDQYVVIKETSDRYDPAHYVTSHLQADIADFCETLSTMIASQKASSFVEFFKNKSQSVEKNIGDAIEKSNALTEPFVSRAISEMIPTSSCLYLSNSMPVRDMDLYAKTIDKPIIIGTNRGVSGIDGILSTASGFAVGRGEMLTLVIGDVAMLHDLNSLSLLKNLKVPIVIVVINNQGGGIFDFLTISQYTDVFEDYFAMPHNYDFKGACETFKISYAKADEKESFTNHYQAAINQQQTMLIEVVTNRQDNLKLRKQIKNQVLEVLQQDIQ